MNQGRLLCEMNNSEIKSRFSAAPPAYLILRESIYYLKKDLGKTVVGIQSYSEAMAGPALFFLTLNDAGAYMFVREGINSDSNSLSATIVLFDNKTTALQHLNEEVTTVVWSRAMLYRVSLSDKNDVVLKIMAAYDSDKSYFYLDPGKHKIHPDNYERWIEKMVEGGGIVETIGKRRVAVSLPSGVTFSGRDAESVIFRPGEYVFTRIPTSEFMTPD